MTKADFLELLEGVPDDMPICILKEDNLILPICEMSAITDVAEGGSEGEGPVKVFLLMPCICVDIETNDNSEIIESLPINDN